MELEGGRGTVVEKLSPRRGVDEMVDEGPQGGSALEEADGPRVGASTVRCSQRLAAKEATSIFHKAAAQRARRDELECCEGGRRTRRISKKKIRDKSAMCGVLLSGGDLSSFVGFETRTV